MSKFFSFIFVVVICAGLYNWATAGSRKPDLSVALSDADALTLASTILARGKITGCGDMRILGQIPGRSIRVTCRGNTTERTYRVSYFPDFEVNARPVADRSSMSGLMNEERLGRIHCVKFPDGTWEKSYLREMDAIRRAQEISAEMNKGAFVYYGYNGSWLQMGDDGDGTWSTSSGEFAHDPKGHGPKGCRI